MMKQQNDLSRNIKNLNLKMETEICGNEYHQSKINITNYGTNNVKGETSDNFNQKNFSLYGNSCRTLSFSGLYSCPNNLFQPSFYEGSVSNGFRFFDLYDKILVQNIGQRHKLREVDNFPIPVINRKKRERRTSNSGDLDILLASLNLNEFSLPEVHLAMGKAGAATNISPAKEKYYRKLFDELDVDNDGRVDVEELKQAYSNMGMLQIPGQAEKFVSASDKNKDGELDVAEFIKYLHEHEMKLQLMFKKIDRDKDGKISGVEIQQALKSVGITLSNKEMEDFVKKMDKDKTSTIDLDEWVEHHLLHPSTDIKDMVFYWRHSTVRKLFDLVKT